MKCALRASVAPAFISAGVLSLVIHRPIHLAMLWIALYGMGLLATHHFAPRSLIVLGMTFFLTGCGLLVSWKHLFVPDGHIEPSALVVSGLMAAATFGGFHLAYAAAVWALGEDRRESAPTMTGIRSMFDFDRLDKLIHEKGRLAIMTLLAARASWPFQDLKGELKMSDGNLITHLRALVQVTATWRRAREIITLGPRHGVPNSTAKGAEGFPELFCRFWRKW